MSRISIRPSRSPMGRNQLTTRTGLQDPIEFVPEVDAFLGIKMLKEVRAMEFFHRLIRPWPSVLTQIKDDVYLAIERQGVHARETLFLVRTTTEIQFHAATPIRDTIHCGLASVQSTMDLMLCSIVVGGSQPSAFNFSPFRAYRRSCPGLLEWKSTIL